MIVQMIRRDRQVAAVKFRDEHGAWQGRIVPIDAVSVIDGKHVVPDEAINSGTEYGFDWSIVFPEPLSISAGQLQKMFRDYGIWQLDDLLKMPNEGIAAFLALAKTMYVGVVKRARECIVK